MLKCAAQKLPHLHYSSSDFLSMYGATSIFRAERVAEDGKVWRDEYDEYESFMLRKVAVERNALKSSRCQKGGVTSCCRFSNWLQDVDMLRDLARLLDIAPRWKTICRHIFMHQCPSYWWLCVAACISISQEVDWKLANESWAAKWPANMDWRDERGEQGDVHALSWKNTNLRCRQRIRWWFWGSR